jgi:G6PDH family F420-dependent oxidoreductase
VDLTKFGYTMMCEQTGPKELVTDVQAAEAAGFDFAVISDHYFPWLDSMGHSPYAWSVFGAAAYATERIDLMTYVTCPIERDHLAVVAQKAATIATMSDGRFTLGLGAGENLNEHVTGAGWPPVNTRHKMLLEALDIIKELFSGEYVNYRREFFEVDSAKLWDLPDRLPPLGVAVSGGESCRLAAEYADVMIAVEPEAKSRSKIRVGRWWRETQGWAGSNLFRSGQAGSSRARPLAVQVVRRGMESLL